jgi:hypothetical protein
LTSEIIKFLVDWKGAQNIEDLRMSENKIETDALNIFANNIH